MRSAGARWCVAIAAGALLACSGRPSDGSGVAAAPRDAGAVARVAVDAGPASRLLLSWGGVNRFGSDLLTIDGQLDLRHEYREASGRVTRRGPVRLQPADLVDLEAVLRQNGACGLASAPGYVPVPEESKTSLAVEIGGMRCAVALYANEWRSQPAAAPIERAITALSLRVQRARP